MICRVRDVEAALAEALGDQAAVFSPPRRRSALGSKTSTRHHIRRGRSGAGRGEVGLPVPGRQLLPDAPGLARPSRFWPREASPAAASPVPPPGPGPGQSADARTSFPQDPKARARPRCCRAAMDIRPDQRNRAIVPKALGQGVAFIAPGMPWRRSRPGCKPKSRTPTGSSSLPATTRPARPAGPELICRDRAKVYSDGPAPAAHRRCGPGRRPLASVATTSAKPPSGRSAATVSTCSLP